MTASTDCVTLAEGGGMFTSEQTYSGIRSLLQFCACLCRLDSMNTLQIESSVTGKGNLLNQNVYSL